MALYLMIVRDIFLHVNPSSPFFQALTAWFYPGQPEISAMLNCPGTVSSFLSGEVATFKHVGTTAGAHVTSGSGERHAAAPSVVSSSAAPTATGVTVSNATLSQKLQALLILYDVLLADKQDEL